MESFSRRLKNEMFYGLESTYKTFEEFSKAIDKYINYYNNERIQTKTKWMSPVRYRETSMIQAINDAKKPINKHSYISRKLGAFQFFTFFYVFRNFIKKIE